MANSPAVDAAVARADANAAATVAAVTTDAAQVVEAAAADVAAAQETAQQIVEAAMHTPLAQRVTDLEEEAEAWERQIENNLAAHGERIQTLESQVQTLANQLQEALTKLSEPQPALIVTQAQTDQSSILPNSTAPQTEVEAAVIIPAQTEAAPAENAVLTRNEVARRQRML